MHEKEALKKYQKSFPKPIGHITPKRNVLKLVPSRQFIDENTSIKHLSNYYQINTSGIFTPTTESIKIVQGDMSKKVTMELKELDDIAGNTAYIERDHETLNRDI